MNKLAVILAGIVIAGVAFGQRLHDMISLPSFTIASNATAVVTNEFLPRGIAKSFVVYSTGAGPVTATVTTVRSDGTRTMVAATGITSGTPLVSNLTAYALFDEKILLTVASAVAMTGTASVTSYLLYEK